MVKKVLILAILLGIGLLSWLADTYFLQFELGRWTATFIALGIIYFLFKVAVEQYVNKRIQDNKSRYKFRKTASFAYLLGSAVVGLRIWVEDPQTLIVAYGLTAAGIAIALQDIFKNFAGSIVLLINNIYQVGDRVEINGHYGDVIDIGLMNTTMLEIREWVDGDQATGRLSVLPNGNVLSKTVNNYTKDHSFMWEEIQIPITYDSDWRKAHEIILKILRSKTGNATKKAEKEIAKIGEKYYLSQRDVEPSVFVNITDNWISFRIRFVTDVRDRRLVHNELSQEILTAIQDHDDITIASETLSIHSD